MTQHQSTARRAASAAALLAAAGLALVGCKSSASASGAGSTPAAGTSSAAASGGSGSGGGSQTSSSLGTSYFPIALGNTWVYRTHLSGGTQGTATNKVTKVVPVAGGQRVTMQVSTDVIGKGRQPITITYLFHSNGSITVPFSQFAGGAVKIKSGSIVWPSAAELASGRPQHSTLVFDSTIVGHTTHGTAHITVQGGGSQTVTVPAGTYHADVIKETISEKVEGIAISLRLRTWVANGVGPVRSDLTTKSGAASVPGTVEELVSFKKG